jgi:hypothetical protein
VRARLAPVPQRDHVTILIDDAVPLG